MITTSDFIHLPYTRDLTEGGIAYAVRSLAYTYNRMGGTSYDRLRRIVAGVAVELAFRRFLAEQNVAFDVQGATPFTDPDHYDVSLGGRRCDIKSFLITYREQIAEMRRNPQVVLHAPALYPSDQNSGEGHTHNDIYLFAFLSGLVAASNENMKKVVDANQPHYMIHALPEKWARPSSWISMGALAFKSDSEQSQFIEIGGQDAGREMRSLILEIPPCTRIQIADGFHSLAYVRSKTIPSARLAVHSPRLKETHIIGPTDWGNIWVYGMDILLAGFLTREEFNNRASFVHEGVRVFQYERTRTKNLAVNVSELRPVFELVKRAKEWNEEVERSS